MVIKKIIGFIEKKRNSKNYLFRYLISLKDMLWRNICVPINYIITRIRLNRSPIVIGGCGRSGTTLLLSILSAHPSIFAIDSDPGYLCPAAYSKRVNINAKIESNKIYKLLAEKRIPRECKRWCEKTPKNILFFDKIFEHFGGKVKLIQIVRDGRDVILSKHPDKPREYWIPPQRWIDDVYAGIRYLDNPYVLTIRYEDLIIDFPKTIRVVLDFIDEENHNNMATWHRHASVKSHDAWFHDARPIYSSSIGKWKNTKNKKIVDELMAIPEARKLLKRFGYIN